jgi:predicted transcriptional regulator
MDLIHTSNKYLNILYLKSKDDYGNGFNSKTIAKLLGLESSQAHNVMKYLSDKGLIDATSGFAENIKLTASGIDAAIKNREKRIFKIIKFKGVSYLPSSRDAIEFLYYYDLIEEGGKTQPKTIKIGISGSLSIGWGFQIWSMQPDKDYPKLMKILLQIGKDKIVEKVKEGTLNDNEELILLTTTHPNTPPYNADNLIEPENAEYEIEVGQKMLSEEIKENKLAASIIETRDRINAIFNFKYGSKLLLLNEERNLLDFFKIASTEEEFYHRLASLAQVSRNMDVAILRKLSGERDTKIGSVGLLDKFLQSINKPDKTITDILRQIGRIRQGYPVHTDIADVVQGYKYFGLNYPISDYEGTWTTLLKYYLTSLTIFYEILADTYLAADNWSSR